MICWFEIRDGKIIGGPFDGRSGSRANWSYGDANDFAEFDDGFYWCVGDMDTIVGPFRTLDESGAKFLMDCLERRHHAYDEAQAKCQAKLHEVQARFDAEIAALKRRRAGSMPRLQ